MDAENKGGFICVRCQKEHSTAAQSCLGHTSPLALPSCSFLGRACCGQHGGLLSVASWPFSPPSLLVVSPGLPQPLEGGGTTQLVNSPGPDCVCPICKPRPCSPGRCPPPPTVYSRQVRVFCEANHGHLLLCAGCPSSLTFTMRNIQAYRSYFAHGDLSHG